VSVNISKEGPPYGGNTVGEARTVMTLEKQKPGYDEMCRAQTPQGESHLTGHADGGTERGIPGACCFVENIT
jgi:hypothetical protein